MPKVRNSRRAIVVMPAKSSHALRGQRPVAALWIPARFAAGMTVSEAVECEFLGSTPARVGFVSQLGEAEPAATLSIRVKEGEQNVRVLY